MSSAVKRFEKHIVIQNNALALDVLAAATPLSKQQLKQVMLKGAVWLTKGTKTTRIRRAKKSVQQGERLHLYYDPQVLNSEPPIPTLISDEGPYSVWNKPYGLLSQGSKWGDFCTVARFAEQHLLPQRPSFIVHRLDRAANGLLLLAHEKKAASALSALFQQRAIDKRYHIWVHGEFSAEATAVQPIKVDSEIDGRQATSYFTRLKFDATTNRSLLDVTIETGRKHQIRRHSAHLGFPIVGDRLHGIATDGEDLQLSAYYLAFVCPFSHSQKTFSLTEEGKD